MSIADLFMRKGTGALLDTRPVEEKLKDFTFEETVATANPVKWREKPQKDWRRFPIFDQNGSGSCVAQTLAKLLGVLYWLKTGQYVHFSATHIYQRRVNRPSAGMIGVDGLNIIRNGTTLEQLAPSQAMTDAQMDSFKIEPYNDEVGKIFRTTNYVMLPNRDIDTIASVIQTTGKAVMVWYFFKYNEWNDYPTIINQNLQSNGQGVVRHSVTAVDFTMYKGKKALIIEDSWGQMHGLKGQRVITEDFHKARNFFSAYPINFDFSPKETEDDRPRHTFKKTLAFSPTFVYETDVAKLQDILKYEGLFPDNIQSTGYYGAITARAVHDFQVKHKVAPIAELNALQGNRIGEKTIAKLNRLYG